MTLDVLHVDGGNDDSNLILHNEFLLLVAQPSSVSFFYAESGKKLVFIPHDNSNLPINNNNWCATHARNIFFMRIVKKSKKKSKIY